MFWCISIHFDPSILSLYTIEMCAAAKNLEKSTKTSYFENSRSFKVIHVYTTHKLVAVTSACYNIIIIIIIIIIISLIKQIDKMQSYIT